MIRPTTMAIAIRAAGQVAMRLADPEPSPPIRVVSLVSRPAVACDMLWQPDMDAADGAALIAHRRLAWRDTVLALAGPIAELHWRHDNRAIVRYAAPGLRRACLSNVAPAAGSYLDIARQRLLWARPDDPAEAFAIAYECAEAAVARWWREISPFARVLAQEGTLDGDQVLAAWSEALAGRGASAGAAAA